MCTNAVYRQHGGRGGGGQRQATARPRLYFFCTVDNHLSRRGAWGATVIYICISIFAYGLLRFIYCYSNQGWIFIRSHGEAAFAGDI